MTKGYKKVPSDAHVGLIGLTVAALGVVFGDIGTSPLYAINQVFFGDRPIAVTQNSVLGVISLAFWALTIIITIKYVMLVLRADYKGLGGVFALKALLNRYRRVVPFLTGGLLILSAGLLVGDGMITPAISVLSAVEGLKVAAPNLTGFVIPLTCAVLLGLFSFQFMGASKVGRLFGPIISVWFIALALLGLNQVVAQPTILEALNPLYAISFLSQVGLSTSFIVLGSIMLVVTGGEALYADMGHFGKRPIRLAWFILVYPALVLNYLGQGAYLLSDRPVVSHNLFFSLVPPSLVYSMVFLATLATIIASQALISGVFSLVVQGMSQNLLPRIRVSHTHEEHEGQVYVPMVNWALCLGCIVLVLAFRTSANLASAYGLAVAGDMLVTSIAMIAVTRLCWRWPGMKSFTVFGLLALVDVTFLGANSLKLLTGGYVPLTIGLSMFLIMKSWQWGRRKVLQAYSQAAHLTVAELIQLKQSQSSYFPRSVMLLTPRYNDNKGQRISGLMQLLIDNYGIMPRHIIMLTITTTRLPYVPPKRRYRLKVFENREQFGTVVAVNARYGFMEVPEIREVVDFINHHPQLVANEPLDRWVVFAGHERILPHSNASLADRTKFAIFHFLHRNALPFYTFCGFDDALNLSTETLSIKI